MRYQYGSFVFEDGEASLDAVQRSLQTNSRGEPFLMRETHRITGEIIPPQSADTEQARQTWIDNRIRQIEAAFAQGGRDGVLLNNSGSPTVHRLQDSSSVSGVQVVQPPSFGKQDEAEFISGRTFTVVLSAEYPAEDAAGLYEYRETIAYQGDGGPEFVAVECDSGPPIIQRVRDRTIQVITQRGQAVGIGFYPTVPPAIYPQLPRASRPVIERQTPQRRGKTDLLYPVSWQFSMFSTSNVLG